MTTATTNNPSSSLGLSSVQLNSLALAPSSTELLDVSNAMQSNFESGGTSGFGSFPLVTFPDGNSLTVFEAFGMRSSNSNVGALVTAIITNADTVAAIWKALMSNDVIREFLKTGRINMSGLSQQLDFTGGSTASESASMVAERGQGIWAIIGEMLKVFLIMWDMIKGFMDQLFLGRDGAVELNEESRRQLLQISLAISKLIFLGVLAARLMLMV